VSACAAGDHVIVVDLGYGDAGKGSIVDWLCSRPGRGSVAPARPRVVVRFNGGAQAAHNVLTPDGRHHTFAQFGSGTFTPDVRTHLSRFVLVDPLALAAEAAHLASVGVDDALDRLTVDRDALITTPYHRLANQARERARGAARHGSCGMGVGETASYALEHPDDAPRVGDCAEPRRLTRKLTLLRDWLLAEFGTGAAGSGTGTAAIGAGATAGSGVPPVAHVSTALGAFAERVRVVGSEYLNRLLHAGPAVFEGAQGVLLDEWHGFHPYTTWSTTTFANAETLLAEAGRTGERLGVIRCYMTRHGPGPLVTEDTTLELPDSHNGWGPWQGSFRVGHLDAVALRYAIEVAGGVDGIALTHLDVAGQHPLRICDGYVIDGQRIGRLAVGRDRDLVRQERMTNLLLRARPVCHDPGSGWPAVVADALASPVTVMSYGPTVRGKAAVTEPAVRAMTG
jgi:adenylosuccinate synthase